MNATGFAPTRHPKVYSLLLANQLMFVQEGLAALCTANPKYEVVGRAFDGSETCRRIEEQRPDIAVVDLRLPISSGLEILRSTKAASPQTKVIILASSEDRDMLAECLQAGARAFMLETASPQDFLEAFSQVAGGGVFISTGRNLLECLSSRRSTRCDRLHVLARRERQVLSLLAAGLPMNAIADRMELRPATVATHRARLMRKLDIHNVAGLVRLAFDRNLIHAQSSSGC